MGDLRDSLLPCRKEIFLAMRTLWKMIPRCSEHLAAVWASLRQ